MSVQSRLDVNAVAVAARKGLTDAQIGQMFGVGRMAVLNFRKRYGIAGRPVGPNARKEPPVMQMHYHPNPEAFRFNAEVWTPEKTLETFGSPLVIPPAPFAVPIASPARGMPASGVTKAVWYSDTHFPFQDDAALRVVMGIVRDVRPDVLIHGGDLVDAWQVSRFDKEPSRLDTLQDNIDQARAHLHQMAQVVPNARRVLLEGNHENRLTRAICGLDGVQRELAKLRAFQEAMTWPVLLGLDEIGWEWVPERVQSKTVVLPKIITKHGTVVRKWAGATARGEWERYGKSGISGHTHRIGAWHHRDSNGLATWVEGGCTCKLEAEYGSDFDWAQGCVVFNWTADHRLMDVEIVTIRDGTALYRGKEYVG